MKRMILPLVIAMLAGLGGGSGFSYVRAKKTAALEKVHADSVKAVEKAKEAKAHAAAAVKVDTPIVEAGIKMTPADSIRAVQSQRLAASTEVPVAVVNAANANAATKSHAVGVAPITPTPVTPTPVKGVAAAPAGTIVNKPSTVGAKTPATAANATAPTTTAAATATPPAVHAGSVEAVENVLPEKRLAKIFGAMQAKEASRVLEQMNDSDVRTILGMMSDRQAAAILGTFPAARAASISKGGAKSPGASK